MKAERLAALCVGAVIAAQGAHASACRNPATPAERTICADPALRAADAQMNADYAVVRAAARAGHLDAALLAGQRTWLAARDRGCTAPGCLALRIGERGKILAALAARVSDANPTLFNLTAAWLEGGWVAGPPQPDTFGQVPDLPPPGARLTTRVGQSCAGEGPQDCTLLALEPDADALGSGSGRQGLPKALGLPAQTPVFTATRGNGGGYSLAAPPDGRLIAFTPACATGGSPCGFVHQAWSPVDAASRLHVAAAGPDGARTERPAAAIR